MRRASSVRARPALFALGLGAALLGISCSGSGRGGGLGSVAVLVTDAPSRVFDRVELRISRVELIGNRRVEIFSGSEAIDLLDLEHFSNPFFVAADVPVGDYRKVRLTVDEMTLTREVVAPDGSRSVEQMRPELPGDGVIDVVPRGSFFVVPGATLVLEIDVDAEKSIQGEDRRPDDYDLRPIAFMRVVDESEPLEKRVRVRGEIREFQGPDAFSLCSEEIRSTRLAASADSVSSVPSCLTVNIARETGILDVRGDRKSPEDLMEGDQVTVLGRLQVLRSASLATTPGRPAADAPFFLAGLDGADLQVDAAVVAAGPEDDELSPSSPRSDGAILTGDVAGLDASSRSFDLANAQGTACVEVAAGARLLLVADDGRVASSTEIPLDDLVAGQTVEAFGAAGAACFQADAVVAFAG
jgi:hypothetical protein